VTVLTLDLGTSATKAALWSETGIVAIARTSLTTHHPEPGRAEQDAAEWWESVRTACREVQGIAPDAYAALETIGFAAARETFVLTDESFTPLGPAILWSDARAADWSSALGDAGKFRAQTGVVAGPAAHAAKLAWIAHSEPDRFAAARWVLAPRDLVVATMTGVVATDQTLASRTGLCALDPDSGTGDDSDDVVGIAWLPDARERYGERLPDILRSASVVGTVTAGAAKELGIPTTVEVVLGAGDRACEVLGVGASPDAPMVSWGTTANVSVPHPGPMDTLPDVGQVSSGALGGFLVEAGLSAAGAAVAWLARLTGTPHDELFAAAATVEPGARGVLALPWLAGARAPWWRPDAHAAFVGLTEAHGTPELARAIVEGVAFDVARCLELIAPDGHELALAGAGAVSELWRSVLAAVSARPVVRRTIDDAASVGARLVVAAARDEALTPAIANPVTGREAPEPALVEAYQPRREAADAAASAVVEL
jgi:xylulokinase